MTADIATHRRTLESAENRIEVEISALAGREHEDFHGRRTSWHRSLVTQCIQPQSQLPIDWVPPATTTLALDFSAAAG